MHQLPHCCDDSQQVLPITACDVVIQNKPVSYSICFCPLCERGLIRQFQVLVCVSPTDVCVSDVYRWTMLGRVIMLQSPPINLQHPPAIAERTQRHALPSNKHLVYVTSETEAEEEEWMIVNEYLIIMLSK